MVVVDDGDDVPFQAAYFYLDKRGKEEKNRRIARE